MTLPSIKRHLDSAQCENFNLKINRLIFNFFLYIYLNLSVHIGILLFLKKNILTF